MLLPREPPRVRTRRGLCILPGLGADWGPVFMHSTDSLTCAFEELDHLSLGEMGAVYRVRVDGVLEVSTLWTEVRVSTMSYHAHGPCRVGGIDRRFFLHRLDLEPQQSP